MNRLCVLAVGLGIATLGVAGCDSNGGTREGPGASDPGVARAEVSAQPRRAPGASATATPPPVDRTVAPGLTALAPIRDGALMIVPIAADVPATSPRYLTLDEGMRRGLVSVRELPETDYGTLRVSNRSDQVLCLATGEIILDGHQDRTFAETLALAPHARQDVTVRCVEPDRDDGPGRAFRSAQAMVHSDLRREVFQGTQSTVWEEVRRYNRAHDLHNNTSTYRFAARKQHQGAQEAWRTRVMQTLASLPERDRIVGAAVALEGRLVSVDVFATPELYRAMEPKLLGSFVAQAVDATSELRTPRPDEIRDLLAGAGGSECGRTAMAGKPGTADDGRADTLADD